MLQIFKIEGDSPLITCDYCNSSIHWIKPVSSNSFVNGLNEMEQQKYSNYLVLLDQAMLAGNYQEAYKYCNKSLEINPQSAQLWENKAICSLWLCTFSDLSLDKVSEIMTYLNASRQNDPSSATFENTSLAIAENLYASTYFKYMNLGHDEYNNNNEAVYSFRRETDILTCIYIIESCFDIYPKVIFLEKAVELILNGKVRWINKIEKKNSIISNRHNFDAIKKLNYLTQKINSIKPFSLEQITNENKSGLSLLEKIMVFIVLLVLVTSIILVFVYTGK